SSDASAFGTGESPASNTPSSFRSRYVTPLTAPVVSSIDVTPFSLQASIAIRHIVAAAVLRIVLSFAVTRRRPYVVIGTEIRSARGGRSTNAAVRRNRTHS